jgi:8-oxo-dGTP pyrophosphatase MutT (NUDIX family)
MPPAPPILRFHAVGNWSPAQTTIERVQSTWRETPESRALIEAAWAAAQSRPGVNLFDGPMCRLESWHATPDRLTLRLAHTTYKTFLGTNLSHTELADQYGQGALANPVGVSPALLTADQFIMMGRRNDSLAYYPRRIHPFAGALDPSDADPFAAIARELHEELAFTDADIADIRCTGVAEDVALRQPELIFLARTTRTRAQVESAVDPEEHAGAWSTPADEPALRRAIESARDLAFTPVGVASLILYGRLAFGEAFFREMSRHVTGQ